MNEIIKNIEAAQLKADAPEFGVGDTVRVHALIKEGNRERIQVFEGTVLKLSLIHIYISNAKFYSVFHAAFPVGRWRDGMKVVFFFWGFP